MFLVKPLRIHEMAGLLKNSKKAALRIVNIDTKTLVIRTTVTTITVMTALRLVSPTMVAQVGLLSSRPTTLNTIERPQLLPTSSVLITWLISTAKIKS